MNNNGYLVIDYTNCKDINAYSDRETHIVSEPILFEWLDKAKNDESIKISVYRIGEMILDWS